MQEFQHQEIESRSNYMPYTTQGYSVRKIAAINVLKKPTSIGLNNMLQYFIATNDAPQTAPRKTNRA